MSTYHLSIHRQLGDNTAACFRILKLSYQFFLDYPVSKYPELLEKRNRAYNCMILELFEDCILCIPYRTEMNHTNGYRFKSSKRSSAHKSGLDYSKMVILGDASYLEQTPVTIDKDEYNETIRNIEKIKKGVIHYLEQYIAHMQGIAPMHQEEFLRKYKYCTLPYFHSELGLFI